MSAEARLVQAFAAQHADEVSRLCEQLAPAAFAEVLEALRAEQAAAIAARVVPLAAALALVELSTETAAAIVLEMVPRSAAVVMLRLAAADRDRLYRALPEKHAAALGALAEYGADRAGGRLDPTVPMLLETLPIADVLDRLRTSRRDALNYVYAIDTERRLSGVISIHELLAAPADATLAALMRPAPHRLFADDPLETIVSHPAWKRLYALPVVDRQGRMLGALRYNALRAIEAELGERLGQFDTRVAPALAELCALGVSAVLRVADVTLEAAPERTTGPTR